MPFNPLIENLPDDAVDPTLDAQLRELLSMSFPRDPCFKTQRHFKDVPLHRWILRDEAKNLVGQIAVHRKTIGTTQGDLIVGGIAEVCVHPTHRGRGYVRAMLREIHAYLEANDYPFAMLFGDRQVYGSSGYIPIDNPLHYLNNQAVWITAPHPVAMIRPICATNWPTGEIDLRGYTF